MDCNQLPGHLRHICNGHDDDGRPISMSEENRQKYLASPMFQQIVKNERALPSLSRQAANYAKSTAKHLARGAPAADTRLYEARVAICKSNACGNYRESDGRCGACGCPVKSKARRRLEACPAEFWPGEAHCPEADLDSPGE